MKLQIALFVLMLAILSSCRRDRVDVRALTPHHRALFAEAAAIEGVDTTIHGRPGDWTVKYDFSIAFAGKSTTHSAIEPSLNNNLSLPSSCEISINFKKLMKCGGDNKDHHFKVVSRHELRHCEAQNNDHSSNPNALMFHAPSCSPVD